jgi:hypothetical protein
VRAQVAGGADNADTAYRLMRVGRSSGVRGTVTSHVSLRLAQDQKLARNLAVFQMRDARDGLLYELYVAGADRTLRLWSPPGGLRATLINVSTGIVVPNDGRSRLNVETVVRPHRSVVVRVGGVARTRVTKLSGGSTSPARLLRVGIDHYDTSSTAEPVTVFHSRLSVRGPK